MPQLVVRTLSRDDGATWDGALNEACTGSVFHRFGWLTAIADNFGGRFHPLVCERRGNGPVCLMPLFEERKGPFHILHSPPPGFAIPYLGPAFIENSDRQKKIESNRREIVEALIHYTTAEIGLNFIRIVGTPEFSDVRPFTWSGFEARPNYTYRFSLQASEGDIWEGFDKRIRQRVKKAATYSGLENIGGNGTGVARFHAYLSERYRGQGRVFKPSTPYLEALVANLGSDIVQLHGFEAKGRVLAAVLFARHKGSCMGWIGGAKPPAENDGLVEMVHWNAIKEARKDGFQTYERVGGNTVHLCDNKAKYNLRPHGYFELTSGTTAARAAYKVYQWKARKKRKNRHDGSD